MDFNLTEGQTMFQNLARDFADASSAVSAWMNSPSHRENILNPNYTNLGVGVAVMGQEIRATQVFVRRK